MPVKNVRWSPQAGDTTGTQ